MALFSYKKRLKRQTQSHDDGFKKKSTKRYKKNFW